MLDPKTVCKRAIGGHGLMNRGSCVPTSDAEKEPRFGINAAGEAIPVTEDGAAIGGEVATGVETGLREGVEVAVRVLGAVGAVAALVPLAMMLVGLVESFTPDHTCPMRARYTELWNPSAAADTMLHAPCETSTTAIYNALATTMPVTTSAPSPTPIGVLSSPIPAPQVTTSTSVSTSKNTGGPWQNTTSTAFASSPTTTAKPRLPGTVTLPLTTPAPSVTTITSIITSTVAVNPTPIATTSPTDSADLPLCPQYDLPKDSFEYVMSYLQGLRCPVPMAYECTLGWYHQNVNKLPAGQRNPNYCTNGDVMGHFRAKEMGCLWNHFGSKECRKTFGLEKMSWEECLNMREDMTE